MALTPDDVIKKNFKPTRLKQGYDETDVDEFLDQVVIELRRLLADNDDLRAQLDDCLAGNPRPEPAATETATDEELARERAERERLAAQLESLSEELEAARVRADEAEAQSARAVDQDPSDAVVGAEPAVPTTPLEQDSPAPVAEEPAGQPAAIIALAQRLHDEHVQEGETTKARLVSEGEDYRDRVVSEADERARELVESGQSRHDELVRTGQERHDELVRTGQEKHDELIATANEQRASVLQDLSSRKSELNGTIDELKSFERDYRTRLRGYLTDQMSLLDRDGDGIPDAQQA